jgi:hypothetical protein
MFKVNGMVSLFVITIKTLINNVITLSQWSTELLPSSKKDDSNSNT